MMGRKHDNKMTSRSNTTVNKGLLQKVTKSSIYQAIEKKARRLFRVEKALHHDQSVRKKE